MNKMIMASLADFIESLPSERFNMSTWSGLWWYEESDGKMKVMYETELNPSLSLHKCNTAGCIAGWAVAMVSNMDVGKMVRTSQISTEAQNALGLTMKEASALFYIDDQSIWFRLRKSLGIKTRCEVDHPDCHYPNCPADAYIADDQITNEIAAKVLRKIVSGEYKLVELSEV